MLAALIFIGVLIFFSLIFNALFERTKVPSVLFLLLIGLLVGPVLGLAGPEDLGRLGRIFTTVTLIVILYESGTRLHIKDIGAGIGPATVLTFANFLIPVAVGMLIGYYLLGLGLLEGAFMGAIVGSISTPIVLPMLQQFKLGKKAESVIFLEAALSDIVCLVGALAILDAMETGSFGVSSMMGTMLKSFVFATLIGAATGYAWAFVRRIAVDKLKHNKFTSLALAFIIFGITEMLGLNGGMAVLVFGFVMGNIGELSDVVDRFVPQGRLTKDKQPLELHQAEKDFYSEMVFIFKTFFFVYIGMSITLSDPRTIFVGLFFIIVMFVVRIPPIMLTCRQGCSPRDRRIMSILTPKGLVTAVLASLPMQIAVTQPQIAAADVIQNIGYASVLFSIILFSLLIFIVKRFDNTSIS